MTTNAKVLFRRDTAANWTSANPTLEAGEIGFETDTGQFKIGDGSTAWGSLDYAGGLFNLVEDTTPQLGGALDVNGQTITSTSNADVIIDPNGTGNVVLGNFTLDADQTVGAGQDGYPLTYDHASGLLVLAAPSGGSGVADGDYGDITVSSSGTVWSIDAGVITVTQLADSAVSFAKIQNMTEGTVIGRPASTGTGAPSALNASDIRTLASLVPGTDVQAYDAGLASIAGLTTAADRMIYTTASDTYAVATLTSFARTLLDDADAATARATLGAAAETVTVNAQSGTTYTLVLGDAGDVVTMSNASANTLTIPTNASVAFPTGTIVNVVMLGAGTTSIAGATGVTLNGVSAGSGDISAQYGAVALLKIGTDTWVASGAIGTVA